MFRCPQCKSELIRAKCGSAFSWNCPACSGRAATISALRQTIEPAPLNTLWQMVCNNTSEGIRPCPACQKGMIALPVESGSRNFELDVCKRCQFVWFDRAEFHEMPFLPPKMAAPEPVIPQPIREKIAIEQVTQMAEVARRENFESDGPDEWWQSVCGFFGMPVELDNPVEIKPWATWGIALAILAVSLWSFSDLPSIVQQYGLIPSQAFRLNGATLITSFFLHGGIWHLVGNLYFLLVFGDNVEEFIGRARYIFLLVLATLCGDFLHAYMQSTSTTPCIGASGGISGVITFYALQFPGARIGFLWRWAWRYRWFSIPALAGLALWGLQQGIGVYMQLNGFSNVSALAHLGGALAGLFCWVLWNGRPMKET